MEDNGAFHPIACESCRNKKSKCDREIPVCSQCTTAGVACKYPQMNKRGIPQGYVSHIEQRLVQMEVLAIELLSACQGASVSLEAYRLSENQRRVFADLAQKQSKSDKIEEWKSLPIRDTEQRHTWWLAKQGGFLAPGAMSHHERLDGVVNVGMVSVSGQTDNLRSVESLPSLAQTFPQSHSFAVSPSPSVLEGAGINSPEPVGRNVGVTSDVRPSAGDQDLDTHSLSTGIAAEMSPPASRNVAVDRWRKYF